MYCNQNRKFGNSRKIMTNFSFLWYCLEPKVLRGSILKIKQSYYCYSFRTNKCSIIIWGRAIYRAIPSALYAEKPVGLTNAWLVWDVVGALRRCVFMNCYIFHQHIFSELQLYRLVFLIIICVNFFILESFSQATICDPVLLRDAQSDICWFLKYVNILIPLILRNSLIL